MQQETKLFNKNLIIILIASFLMFTGFYLLLPIIAMYVIDVFHTDSSTAGIVVSVYIITALLTRPFSGYLVDRFDRRKFFLATFGIFSLLFVGYIVAGSVLALILTRVLLGATFSFVTTASSTLSIDLMPTNRRNEGIGYMGAITVISMAIGPMLGLYLIDMFSYHFLFCFAFATVCVGFIIACFIKTEPRPKVTTEPLSLDRFLVKEGISVALVIMLLYFLYGTLMTYVSLYVRECNLTVNSGNYFMALAAGIIVSRVAVGRLLNRGLHNIIIQSGLITIIVAMIVFIFFVNDTTFICSSLLIGIGFGFLSPSIQSMIIDLVPHNRRGSANSTFFVALDLGSGMGMLLGGVIAKHYNYQTIYMIGTTLAIISLILYNLYSKKNYDRHISTINSQNN